MKWAPLSKTIFVNIIIAIIGIIEVTSKSDVIPTEWVGYLLLAIAILGVILRTITSDSVSWTKPTNGGS